MAEHSAGGVFLGHSPLGAADELPAYTKPNRRRFRPVMFALNWCTLAPIFRSQSTFTFIRHNSPSASRVSSHCRILGDSVVLSGLEGKLQFTCCVCVCAGQARPGTYVPLQWLICAALSIGCAMLIVKWSPTFFRYG